MLIGYARVSKVDGSQNLDLQIDALKKAGVCDDKIYHDKASGKAKNRSELESCLKALREGDTLVIWKLDRLGRSLHDLVNLIQQLSDKNIGLKVLTGKGANIDTSTPYGKMFFGFFAVLAEFERDLIIERTKAGLESARARGRKGGRKHSLSKSQIRLAQAAMGKKETVVSELCKELRVTRPTLYRYVGPDGALRSSAKLILNK
ncbi:recombinase family protein [Thiotrichales bacterium 19S11-10]|nr:recombinase family protein [Thiotrichales bacterium 19S11-10]